MSADAGVDAALPAPADAAAIAVTTLHYASVAELLGLTAGAPSDRLAGYQLGQAPDAAWSRIEIPGWWASARAVVRDGKVAHVVVELGAADDDGAKLAAVLDEIARRWGTPRKGSRPSWRGKTAQLFAVEYDGFLRGTSSLVVDLLPAGDDHVCGSRDGFAAFFARFEKALVGKDDPALAALVTLDAANDMAFCTDPGEGATYARCAAALLPRLPATPECSVSHEVYYWRTIEKHHGGAYFVFSRSGSTWKASGPIGIGHDDDPNPTAP